MFLTCWLVQARESWCLSSTRYSAMLSTRSMPGTPEPVEQHPAQAPVRSLDPACTAEGPRVEQGRVLAGGTSSQPPVRRRTIPSSSPVPGPRCCQPGGTGELGLVGGGCRWWASMSMAERVSRHRQVAEQVQSLHHHVALPLHPLVVPLYQGGWCGSRLQQPVRKDKNMSVNMYDRAQRESSKTINLPDLLVGEGQRELVPQVHQIRLHGDGGKRRLVPKLHQILCHAVNSVHAWHPRVIHNLRKKKKHKN